MHLATAPVLQVQCRRHLRWKLEIEQSRDLYSGSSEARNDQLPQPAPGRAYRDTRTVPRPLSEHGHRRKRPSDPDTTLQVRHSHPSELTEADIVAWATHANPANNTVYSRVSRARTFLRWCERNRYVDNNVTDHLADLDSPLRTYKRTYGKVQAKNPGRWLTHEQAYGQLRTACQDGTAVGLRDEVVICLGLMGMRVAEIAALAIDNLRQLPTITWTGKGRKPHGPPQEPHSSQLSRNTSAATPTPSPRSPRPCP
jgi:integrase